MPTDRMWEDRTRAAFGSVEAARFASDLAHQVDTLTAERDRYRDALEKARGICEDAADMGCECAPSYYTCNGCPDAIASRAGDALDDIDAALRSATTDAQEGTTP